jgi:hypothetical protein
MKIVKKEDKLESSKYLLMSRTKIENLEKMVQLLNKRKSIITSAKDKLSEFDENERAILLHKTDYDLAKHHTNLISMKKEVNEYITEATKIVDEMEVKWDEVVAKAKKEAVRKKDIANILSSKTEEELNNGIDEKLNYYLQLKSMVYNTGKLKKA